MYTNNSLSVNNWHDAHSRYHTHDAAHIACNDNAYEAIATGYGIAHNTAALLVQGPQDSRLGASSELDNSDTPSKYFFPMILHM